MTTDTGTRQCLLNRNLHRASGPNRPHAQAWIAPNYVE